MKRTTEILEYLLFGLALCLMLVLFVGLSACGGDTQQDPEFITLSTTSFIDSGEKLIEGNDGVAGEPFIVFDDDIQKWRMYFFRSGQEVETINTAVADDLEGPWVEETRLRELDGHTKFALLVDALGEPVRLGGNYYAYLILLRSQSDGGKAILVTNSSSLSGPWSRPEIVIERGEQNAPDGASADAPSAIFYNGTIYLWYMAQPAQQLKTFGFGHRLMVAKSLNPSGPFTKIGIVLNPSEKKGDWDYGWIGGAQVRFREDGRFWMAYNASDTRPVAPTKETAKSAWGFAVAESPDGSWEKLPNPMNTPSESQENIWRPFVLWDELKSRWIAFYNAGQIGHESITYATQELLAIPNPEFENVEAH